MLPPGPFFPDYEPEIDDDWAERLELTSSEDALVLVLVTPGATAGEATANLLAPVVINVRTRRAAQIVLDDAALPLRAPLPTAELTRSAPLGQPTYARANSRPAPAGGEPVLVLSRRIGESIIIGDDIVVTVLEVRGDVVRVGIAAPRSIRVHREEVYRELEAANRAAAGVSADAETALAAVLPKPPTKS